MRSTAWHLIFRLATSFRIHPILAGILFIFFIGSTHAQNACPAANATQLLTCPGPNQSITMSVQAFTGSTYTWYKDGTRLAGPLPGDGNFTSFAFALHTFNSAGHYTIEKKLGGNASCVGNTMVAMIPLPVSQDLTGGEVLCSGERILSLSASEADVTYELLADGFPTGITINSTGNTPIDFPPVTQPGSYSVRAKKNACPEDVFSFFGNAIVTDGPKSAILNYTTTNSANISWPGSGNFIVEYGLAGFTPGTGAGNGAGGTVILASSSPVSISGLTSATVYDVYIRQLCSPGNYNSSPPASFLTDCPAISVFPYSEGFESVTPPELPACWKSFNLNDDIFSWQSSGIFARTGTNCVFLNTDYSISFHHDYLLLPPMILTGNQRLKYWVRALYAGYPQLYQVRISTTNNSLTGFSNVLLTETISSPEYEEKTLDLDAYTGLVYITILVPRTAQAAYSIALDDFTIENIPPCPGPSFVKLKNTTNNSAAVSWAGSGSFIVEYGPVGFIPGTGATAGAGGTVISSAVSPQVITGLSASTSYDVYIRQNCTTAGNGFSINSDVINFTTFFNCIPLAITTCTNVSAGVAPGNGIADFDGVYPANSSGSATPGKELLYSFTPDSTGVYYLDITSLSDGMAYLYKPSSSGCGNTGWTGIANIYSIGKYPVGLLQKNTQYYILLDNPGTSGRTQTFRICRAAVVTPLAVNTCISTTLPVFISSHSMKPEYIIDQSGNLLAALDFSAVSNAVGTVSLAYYVNSGPVRRDNSNKEYLDRNFNIATTNAPANPVGVTLFFTNLELQHLIDEPNDGIADVSSIADLRVTRNAGSCNNIADEISSLISQSGNGIYDISSKYIQFNTPGFSSFYLHGGSVALFNSTMVCSGSTATLVMEDAGAGFTYQWQADTGAGYVNLSNDNTYSDVTTPVLTINYPPSSYYGYKYRCVATKGTIIIVSDAKTLKFSITWTGEESSAWENPNNWSCSSPSEAILPDANTDVIIPAGRARYPVVNSNSSCRSILARPGAMLTVTTGFNLNITGP